MTQPQSRDVAIMFADISGSTRLYDILGNAQALKSVEQCLGIMKKATETNGGRVIKTIGDEVMALFPNADTCLLAASEIQTQIFALPPINDLRLAVRIGFHYGPVIEEADDAFGDAVNVASRLADRAKAGQIITTKQTVSTLSAFLRTTARDLNLMTVKGKSQDIHISEIIWQANSEATMMVGQATEESTNVGLCLTYRGKTLYLNGEKQSATLGRDSQSDLVVDDKKASRLHAKIERRRDKFVLIDQSTNGSYVTIKGYDEMLLRHEEVVLREDGRISFGHSSEEPDAEFVEFVCE